MMMIPLTIILQSCYGSIVALYTLSGEGLFYLGKLTITTLLCMAYNAAILAQLKVIYIFYLLYASVFLNTIILLTMV
ncbi:MAG: hypothetical protein AAF039_13285 [Bacteroidota bacterium]